MNEGLLINSKVFGRKFCLFDDSLIDAQCLWSECALVHICACVCVFIHTNVCVCLVTCTSVCCRASTSVYWTHIYMCVQYTVVESIQSKSFLVYLKEVQMVFKELEASSEPGPSMWARRSHIDSILFECVRVPFTCMCLYDLFKVTSIHAPVNIMSPQLLLHIQAWYCQHMLTNAAFPPLICVHYSVCLYI